MIRTFRHRGLKRLFQRGDASAVGAQQRNRVEDVLAHLDVAVKATDLGRTYARAIPKEQVLIIAKILTTLQTVHGNSRTGRTPVRGDPFGKRRRCSLA